MCTHYITDGSDAHDEEESAARRQDRGNRATVVDATELERMACHASRTRAIPHAMPGMARTTVCGGRPREIGWSACPFVIESADWRTAGALVPIARPAAMGSRTAVALV